MSLRPPNKRRRRSPSPPQPMWPDRLNFSRHTTFRIVIHFQDHLPIHQYILNAIGHFNTGVAQWQLRQAERWRGMLQDVPPWWGGRNHPPIAIAPTYSQPGRIGAILTAWNPMDASEIRHALWDELLLTTSRWPGAIIGVDVIPVPTSYQKFLNTYHTRKG